MMLDSILLINRTIVWYNLNFLINILRLVAVSINQYLAPRIERAEQIFYKKSVRIDILCKIIVLKRK